ncbi:2-keto-4-pentenoate hydratase/2-oxohepta-3-ene-1,7-dioic acid hydratase (catechol pathway) [Prosthecobacter debontii]|uniref:2-keto-4-pentenoate hydratase/2-oxohepta-3-ene-1,7-dioic acid hydratase (Catechol pathway) n=1 Tax=Prosthecobacter debontii TaxID=48467 RepID=A0A1T4XSU9_9BACT|nr:fumarylacetoacetate hydrolase family protein [Prosthecobacter debontii]SKA92659.1 2-keto-4-pentenoate hydratase/2-oxohepta-3-ene-1,7-dioic acid hydratase (catechol pathway) [Prosthecobacter debontii]
MKIIRYSDSSGQIGYAAQQADGSAKVIQGDIFGSFEVTDAVAGVAKILAPVQPTAILCIGLNYKFHAEESGAAIPENPVLFMKSPGAVQNPGDAILLPRVLRSDQVDYECELAVVIGKTAKNVSKEKALDYVLGYTCANDVSARDWQKNGGGGQWCRGKTFDTFCPLGPVLVTRDEIANPNALGIKTILNGEAVQDWNTNDMIFDVPTIIAFLSASTTLLPGTVILTGTPHGVGMARKPPLWMKAGDSVSVEIEGIGTLTNPVEEEVA